MVTKVRPRHAGASYRLTMRCSERRFVLTPTPKMVQLMGFNLGHALQRTGVFLHSCSFMSNHMHLDVTDVGLPRPHTPDEPPELHDDAERPDEDIEVSATLSEFVRTFKSNLARSGNCHLGRWEPFWAPGYGCQEIETPEAAKEGEIYTIGNPILAWLVATAEAWPGLITTADQLAVRKPRAFATFKKPKGFFRSEADSGTVPDEVTLVLHPHPMSAMDPEGFVRDIKRGVKEIADAQRKKRKRDGSRVRGAAAVLKQHWNWSPRTHAPRRKLNPKVADPNPLVRLLKIACDQWFQSQYDKAMTQWLSTGKSLFPAGTHKMRSMPGVTVASAGAGQESEPPSSCPCCPELATRTFPVDHGAVMSTLSCRMQHRHSCVFQSATPTT